MKDKIIFIDDQETIRHLFGKRLQRLFGDLADIIPLEPKPTTEEMVKELMDMKDVCSYIIDENLTHTGSTNYQGVNLIEKIREVDTKIPIYVLTSDVSTVDALLGDIEFVIDKIDINQPENKVKLLQRFVRHMQTYKDIKSEQSARFDHLLIKSLDQPLSEEELGEFNALNVIRSKVLLDEGCISETDLRTLKEQNELLTDIEAKLQEIVDGK